MGAEIAFSHDADFSDMAKGINIKLEDVVHKASVEVTETGTEAAAATAITALSCCPPSQCTSIKVDRPFVFAIMKNNTCPLFLGRFEIPTNDSVKPTLFF